MSSSICFWDPYANDWQTVDNFLPDDITEAWLAAARCRGCTCHGGGTFEYGLHNTVPDVIIDHTDDCAA